MRARRPLRILEPGQAYELWAPTYAPSAHNPLMDTEQRAMHDVLSTISASTALDIGTGSGRYLPLLEATGATLIAGVDFSMPMLQRNRADRPLVCGDATAMPFADGRFDIAVASLVVGHVKDSLAWVREIHRVLRLGGHLLYSDLHPSWTLEGWLRTFSTADGRLFAVRHHWRSVEEHSAALQAGGFHVRAIRELHLHGRSGPQLKAWRRRWGNPAVAVLFHATRS